MPDQKISVDPAAADLSGCIIPVVTGGINKQAANSLFGITGVANGVIYSAGNRNTSDPTNFNYVPGTQTLTVVGPIRTSPVTNESTVATPANGMIIYSTALSKFRAYENGAWVNLIGGSGGMTNPMTSIGDLIQGDVAGAPVRLASIAAGNVLITGGVTTASSWGKVTNAHVDSTVAITTSGQTFTGVNVFTSPRIETSITTNGATLNIFTANVSTVTMMSAVTTFTLSGTSQGTATATFFGNATNSGVTKTVSIGISGLSGSITNINLGSAVAGALGTLTLNSTTINGKFIAITATGAFTFAQSAQASGWTPIFTINPGAHTSMTAATEFKDYNFGTRTVTWLAGTTATQRFAHFQGQTVAGASASATFTDLYTVYIDPSIVGSNAIVTNNWALGLGGGLKLFAGTTTRPSLVIPTGTNLTTSQAGAMENDGTHLWFTFANSGARWQLDNQVGTFGWALAGNTLVADGIIGDIGTGGFKISLYTNNTARQVISSKGNQTITQDAQSVDHAFLVFTQANHIGGNPSGITLVGGTHTALTAAAPTPDFALNLNRIVQFATGTFSITQKAVSINAPTYSFVGASTMAYQCAVYISGPPKVGANATTTQTTGLLIDTVNVVTGGGIAGNATGLEVNAPTGATNNYAARFFGGQVNFAQGTAAYAPIFILAGTNMTTPTAGAVENNGTNLFFTPVSTRLAVNMNASAATPATTGTMTTTLTNLSAITITPTGACTFNASGGISGQRCAFVITTSGASSFVLTWGTNYKTTGTLATGTVTAKVFTVEFVYDGTNWNEVARTIAM